MIEITIPETHLYNERLNEFINIKKTAIQLEHSLISLRKWESKWKKPFLVANENTNKSIEEIIDYVRCMTITQHIDPVAYYCIRPDDLTKIIEYINDPMTATTFSDPSLSDNKRINGEIATAEVIYYWMVALNIPVEFQKWHLNQLLTLIKVINIKNSPKKKLTTQEWARRREEINNARLKKYHTTG